MTVWQDVLSYTLSVPTGHTAHQGHTWEKRGWKRLEEEWVCVCLTQEEIYGPLLLPGEILVRIQDASSSDSIINKMELWHAHTHIAAKPLEENIPNVFRKLLCPRRENHFFPFCHKQTNKQLHTFHPHSIMSRFRLGRAAGPAWKSPILGGKFSCPLYLWAIKPITAKWN